MFGQLLKQAAGIEPQVEDVQQAPQQLPQFMQGLFGQMPQIPQAPQRLDMFGQSNQFGNMFNYNRFIGR